MNPNLSERRWAWRGLCIALGGAAALGQAPWGLWWVTLPAFAAVFWLLSHAQSWRDAAWVGWSAGLGYFAIALFWIVEPFLVDIARHGWMAPFALLFMAGGFALFWGAAFGLGHKLGGHGRVAAGVVLLSGAELLRGWILTGFPWAMIGHIWTDHPVLQSAAVFGAGGLTLLTLTLAALPVLMRRRFAGLVVSVALLAVFWSYGAYSLRTIVVPETGKFARVVQPNAPQHLKWDPRYLGQFFTRQLAMTAEPADAALSLVIWPETAVATLLNEAGLAMEAISDAAGDVPVIFGINTQVGETFRNSLALLDGTGALAQTYHKHHLVPFGEYIPLGEALAQLGIRGMAARDGGGFGAGPGADLLEVDGVGHVLPLICYELIFPRHLRQTERADLIVQITNDAWFGNISGPYQHLAQARLRAVEQGIGLVRSANTGVSAVIDPMGRVTRQIPLNQTGYMDAAIPGALPPTLYARTGDGPVTILLLLLLGAVFFARKRIVD
ncbi:MAG: apolipoprotein N-acyltransferase [Pseudomonadota bacterium]